MRIADLSDQDLIDYLVELVAEEQFTVKRQLLTLAEVERRKLYVEDGCDTLKMYCIRQLAMEPRTAGRRATAAVMMVAYPLAEDYVRRDMVTEAAMCKIAGFINAENHAELLDGIIGRTEYDAEAWVNKRFALDGKVTRKYRLPPDFIADQRKLAELLSHKIPDGNEVDVLHEAMKIAIAHLEKQRHGSGQGRARRATSPTRPKLARVRQYIPRAVRRFVWERDGGCCAFVSKAGVRCGSRWQVQIGHIVSDAHGGPPTADNLSLRCFRHNQWEADRDFGKAWMDRCRRGGPPTARQRSAAAPEVT